jgi:hypothetical protein
MKVTLRRVRVTTGAVEKQQVLHILSVCLWPLLIQHAKRMRRIVLSFVACPTLRYFSTLSQTARFSGKTFIEHKARVLIFSTTFV